MRPGAERGEAIRLRYKDASVTRLGLTRSLRSCRTRVTVASRGIFSRMMEIEMSRSLSFRTQLTTRR